MDSIQLNALAKINLGLDVIRRRENGYHEVRMIMQTINLFDVITISKTNTEQISLKTNLPFLPVNENNLVYKAAKLLKEEFSIKQGININLIKNIPVAAGLAGGSSDAASTLIALNRLFDLKLSISDLMERGVKLGADVPYCILGGTSLSEGIGELLTPLPKAPACHILVVKPNIHVSTKYVYEHLNLDLVSNHPDIDGIVEAVKASNLEGIASRLGNVLETVTVKDYPVIDKIKKTMLDAGALNALMSGSGPTVFGLFTDINQAKKAYSLCKNDTANKVFLTNFIHKSNS
jgi:4-diphosphocytidyl-2C-methyl-D-erythritol kinase